jgi:hypothetical protein
MMPSSENEQILFDKYKNDFNKLAGRLLKIGNNEYSIIQMIHYYNLLKFKGRVGKSSLLRIFEDNMNHDRLKSHRTFINMFDSNYDFIFSGLPGKNAETGKYEIVVDLETLYKYLAPNSNPFSSTAGIIKYKDPMTSKTILLELQEEEKNKTSQSGNLDEDMDLIEFED